MVAVQRMIEARGIPTVVVTLDKEQSGLMRPPRAIYPVGFPYGHSLGQPFDVETQRKIIIDALEQLLEKQEPGQIHDKHYDLTI